MGIICSSDTIRNSKQGSRTISSTNKNQKQNAVPDDVEELEKLFGTNVNCANTAIERGCRSLDKVFEK